MHLIKYIDPKPTPPIMRCMLLADRSKSLNFTNKGNVIRSLKLNRLKQDYLKLNHWQLPIGCPHFKSSPPVAPPLASVHRSLNHTRSTHNTRKKKSDYCAVLCHFKGSCKKLATNTCFILRDCSGEIT